MSAASPAGAERVLTVGELTRRIKQSLEMEYPAVWVRGEVSGCKRVDSGHVYFALKEDRNALIDCAMWRTNAQRLTFEPRDGMQVEAFGGVTVYEPRGRYQFSVRELRPAGLGALLLALEELKRRLLAEGLFETARKRALPRYPRRVGLVTSPVGAAVRDMVKVLRARLARHRDRARARCASRDPAPRTRSPRRSARSAGSPASMHSSSAAAAARSRICGRSTKRPSCARSPARGSP
jgi:exodeoxyribonuclease VII large subunit